MLLTYQQGLSAVAVSRVLLTYQQHLSAVARVLLTHRQGLSAVARVLLTHRQGLSAVRCRMQTLTGKVCQLSQSVKSSSCWLLLKAHPPSGECVRSTPPFSHQTQLCVQTRECVHAYFHSTYSGGDASEV